MLQALSFNRQADELESWMDEVESQLSSEDHGKDIISVSNLLKKHQVLLSNLRIFPLPHHTPHF